MLNLGSSLKSGSAIAPVNRAQSHNQSYLLFRKFSFSSFRSIQDFYEQTTYIDREDVDRLHECGLRACDLFRNNLRILLTELDNEAQKVADKVDLIEQQHDRISQLEKHYHLCEISLYHSASFISLEFIKWLKDDVADFSYLDIVQSDNNDNNSFSSKTSKFESEVQLATKMTFIELIHKLGLCGMLHEIWNMLIIHPEIFSILNSNSSSQSSYIAGLNTIQKILSSHPFAEYIFDQRSFLQIDSEFPGIFEPLAPSFISWHESVVEFKNSNHPILGRFPFLDDLLDILAGDEHAILEHCKDWNTYTYAILVFKYPPPLTRIDLHHIITKAIGSFNNKNALNGTNVLPSDERYQEVVCNVMQGRIIEILKSMYKLSNEVIFDSVHNELRLACLEAVSHLSFTLSLTSSTILQEELAKPMATSLNEASFVEELFLELAEFLDMLEYPAEIVAGYLHASLCPLRGKTFASALLSRRCPASDKEALDISNCLRSLDLPSEANAVEISRGTFWLRKSLFMSTLHVASSCASSSAAKAMYFFHRAGDECRVNGLLEYSLYRCMLTVRGFDVWSQSFALDPVAPCSPQALGQLNTEHTCTVSAGERVVTNETSAARALDFALLEAEELLAALTGNSTSTVQASEVLCLKAYVKAVKVGMGKFSLSELHDASQGISNIIIASTAPMRHWLHLLEFSCLLNEIRTEFTESSAELTVVTVMKSEDGQAPAASFFTCVFSKEQVYGLLNALERLECSYLTARYRAAASASNADIRHLRTKLLHMLSASVIQENAGIASSMKTKAVSRDSSYRYKQHKGFGEMSIADGKSLISAYETYPMQFMSANCLNSI